MIRKKLFQLITTTAAIAALMTPLFAFSASGAQSVAHNGVYVALGDSVAAGDGLTSVPNPDSIDKACGLSSQAYPFVVGNDINMPTVDAACSGATIGNLSTAQNANGTTVQPQLNTAFSYGVPSMLSITAGANDVHWDQIVTSCFTSTCGTSAQTSQVAAYIANAKATMRTELQQISSRSQGNPPLTLVTGYYDPLSASCSTVFAGLITPAEVNWVASEVTALNAALKSSLSGYSFSRYVAVTFQGHSVCDSDPWVQGLNAAAPLHPNATGQYGYGFVVLVVYNQAKAAGQI